MPGHPFDNICWQAWSRNIFKNGLNHAYLSDTNYLPLYQYFLWAFGKLAGSEQGIVRWFHYLRCFTILFDFWALWMVWKWGNLKIDFRILFILCIFNIAYAYNTVVWGQVDSIAAALIFASLYTAYRHKLLLSGILIVLAVNMKLQSVVFIPVWGLLMLHALWGNGMFRKTVGIISIMALTQCLLFLPFATAGIAGIKPVWNVLRNSSGYFPQLSMNAYNLWYWVAEKPIDVSDAIKPFLGISYKSLGLLLFMLSSFFALLPLLRKVVQKVRGINSVISKAEIWLAGALIALLFFFCNTEMHERYSHPAFVFIIAYAFYTRRYLPLILFSIAYFINLEGVLHGLKASGTNTFLFDPRLAAALFLFVISYLFLMLYRKGNSEVNEVEIYVA
jgi:Gpi18-like mannosyltransferase